MGVKGVWGASVEKEIKGKCDRNEVLLKQRDSFICIKEQ